MKAPLLFLDANIFFTATYSGTGASRTLFELARRDMVKLTSSAYAIEEARVNIESKLGPRHLSQFLTLVAELTSVDKTAPDEQELQTLSEIIKPKDAPILYGAKNAKADFLITLDKKDFLNKKISGAHFDFQIVLPGQFLQKFLV